MRIIHKSDGVLKRIACEMINIERGQQVYDGVTLQEEPWTSYLTPSKNGVHFQIEIKVGYIAIPYGCSHVTSTSLTECLESIDDELVLYPHKLFNPMNICKNKEEAISLCYFDIHTVIRHINDVTKREHPQNVMYIWHIGNYKDILMLLDTIDINEARIEYVLRSVSCIVYDPTHIFNFDDNHLQVNFPLTKNLTMHTLLLDECVCIHSIYGILWHIYRRRQPIWKEQKNQMSCNEIKIDIYHEDFDNIQLVNYETSYNYGNDYNAEDHINAILEFLLSSKNFAKSNYDNDVCQMCGTLLYEEIYVFELNEVCACICAICVHSYVYKFIQHTFAIFSNITLLRVTYPRTFKDVLILLGYSTKSINIMNYLHNLRGELHYHNYEIWGDGISSIANRLSLFDLQPIGDYVFSFDLQF